MELVMSAATDCGTVRKENEDFFYYSKKKKLIIVCDGMGGHQSGAIASKIAGETVRDVFLYPDLAELMRFSQDFNERLPVIALRLLLGIRLANRRLRLLAENDPQLQGMGTTIVAMAFSEHWACVAHVGDSRVYYLHKKNLKLITEDHSWINELLQDQEIRAEEVKHFRKKNVLTRALGTHPAVKIDVQWFPITGPGKFLLCSDGLHNALGPEHLLKALQEESESGLQKNVEQLVQRAKASNGSDNITAAVVQVKNAHAEAGNGSPKKITIPEEPGKIIELEERFLRTLYAEGMKTKSWRGRLGLSRGRFLVLGLVGFAAAGVGYGLLSTSSPEADEAAEIFDLPANATNAALTSSEAKPETGSIEPRPSDSTHARPATPIKSFNENTRMVSSPVPAASSAQADQESALAKASSLVPRTGGRIFLPGLQNKRYAEAIIFVNDTPRGRVKALAEAGFLLQPGTYTISIKDSTGRVLHQKANVHVAQGDVKTLEFKE